MTEQERKYAAFVEDDLQNNRGRLVNCCEELQIMLQNLAIASIVAERSLNKILTYATTFSELYKPYKNFRKLQDFPIADKSFLKEHWDEIAIKEYAGLPDNRVKFTSGSTGTPFQMVMDRYKHCRWDRRQ